jgi:putative spermidine/putrescine transport system substrate-binding protein
LLQEREAAMRRVEKDDLNFWTALDRRQFLRAGAAGSLGLIALSGTSSLSRPAVAEEAITLTFAGYGGAWQDAATKAFLEPYVKLHPNVKIVQDSPISYAKIRAMAESGQVTWDVVVVGSGFGHDSDSKWLEPIDYGIVDKTHMLPGQAGTYRIGSDVEATVLVYRTDAFNGAVPGGWIDFFDTKKFPGRRAVMKDAAGGLLEAALLADGVPADKLYPIDTDRALKKLDSIKADLVWWTTGAQSEQLLRDNEAVMGILWNGRAYNLIHQGAPAAIQWKQNLAAGGYWVVPKGTPHKEEAMKLIAYMVTPEPQCRFTDYIAYGPTNALGAACVNPDIKPYLPTTYLDERIPYQDEWWGLHLAEVDPKFQDWLLR